ncbi:iron-containing alcohol dehydrogenase [Bradyrhizobium sp. USDA 4469]
MAFIQYMARIQFDFGARSLLADECAQASIRRPLIVSDAVLAANGVLDIALKAIDADGERAPRFLDTPANPTLEAVEAGLRLYRDAGCDGVIAVGGGSPIDAGKAIALLATHPDPLDQYRVDIGGSARIGAIAPMVAMPTTAGTGSEIGRAMGISMGGAHKGVFISPNLVPRAAICDPELTLGLPPRLTAGTGIDALSHCLESFLSPLVNPPADAIALDGIARISRYLECAVADGNDRDARWQVMMGATEAAMTTWKGLGAAHALSIPFDDGAIHHGTLVGVLLPHATEYVLRTVDADKRARLAGALCCGPDAIVATLSKLGRSIGLPSGLTALGIDRNLLGPAAKAAAATSFNRNIARPGDASDYLEIATAAL